MISSTIFQRWRSTRSRRGRRYGYKSESGSEIGLRNETLDTAHGHRGKERISVTDTDLLATPGVASDSEPSGNRESDSGQISKMSENTDIGSGLTGMLLPQLRALAGELGIRGTSGMRKGDLITAIKENQAGRPAAAERSSRAKAAKERKSAEQPTEAVPVTSAAPAAASAHRRFGFYYTCEP